MASISTLLLSFTLSLGCVTSQQLGSQIQCEPIKNSLCSNMAYKSTRMPNFFHDTNQIDASERALQLQDLVSSRCSQHVHAYICELLFPVCLEHGQEAMKKFEIYPCRSFCRRVKTDCELEIVGLIDRRGLTNPDGAKSLFVSRGFNCSSLPFESNGGNGTLRGPCHEIPEVSNFQQAINPANKGSSGPNTNSNSNYHPYEPENSQVPPFISDNSPIYRNVIEMDFSLNGQQQSQANQIQQKFPASKSNIQPQQQTDVWLQFLGYGQTLMRTLSRYSEILSILTIVCLVLALNANRLCRLKSYLSLSSSGSSSNNSSQSSYQSQLKNHHKNSKSFLPTAAAYPPIGMRDSGSPSSSSRSLVLITAGNNQAPSHQILANDRCPSLDASEIPSQNLLHSLSQKTSINFNSTLDGICRHKSSQQGNRYILSDRFVRKPSQPAPDKQHFFNTLDSNHSSSYSTNHYDYIRDSADQTDQQHYSNILLSSPSHQVLLLDSSTPASDQQSRQSLAASNFSRSPAARSGQQSQWSGYSTADCPDSHLSRSVQRSQRSSRRSGTGFLPQSQLFGPQMSLSSPSSSRTGDASSDVSQPFPCSDIFPAQRRRNK